MMPNEQERVFPFPLQSMRDEYASSAIYGADGVSVSSEAWRGRPPTPPGWTVSARCPCFYDVLITVRAFFDIKFASSPGRVQT